MVWSEESTIRKSPFDAVECINGRNTRHTNRRVLDLASELGLPKIAGSDAHKPSNIGAAVMILPDSVHTRDEMIQAILNKQVSLEGSGRRTKQTFSYGSKSIARWMRRGMSMVVIRALQILRSTRPIIWVADFAIVLFLPPPSVTIANIYRAPAPTNIRSFSISLITI